MSEDLNLRLQEVVSTIVVSSVDGIVSVSAGSVLGSMGQGLPPQIPSGPGGPSGVGDRNVFTQTQYSQSFASLQPSGVQSGSGLGIVSPPLGLRDLN